MLKNEDEKKKKVKKDMEKKIKEFISKIKKIFNSKNF